MIKHLTILIFLCQDKQNKDLKQNSKKMVAELVAPMMMVVMRDAQSHGVHYGGVGGGDHTQLNKLKVEKQVEVEVKGQCVLIFKPRYAMGLEGRC